MMNSYLGSLAFALKDLKFVLVEVNWQELDTAGGLIWSSSFISIRVFDTSMPKPPAMGFCRCRE